MNRFICGALASASVVVAMSASGQITGTPPAQQVVFAAPATSAILRVGTEVPLKLTEELTTKGKQLRVGQRFHMEVAEAVLVNGITVIPAGSPAMGEIVDVRNKGMWGKSGHVSARVLYVTVNGRQTDCRERSMTRELRAASVRSRRQRSCSRQQASS